MKFLEKIFNTFIKYSNKKALVVENISYTYSELLTYIIPLLRIINKIKTNDDELVLILCRKSLVQYYSIFSVIFSGLGYVPLNLKWPKERLIKIILNSKSKIIISEKKYIKLLKDLLPSLKENFRVIIPDLKSNLKINLSKKDVIILNYYDLDYNNLKNFKSELNFNNINFDKVCYLLFTSGTTGEPKGIAVKYKNLIPYINYVIKRYNFTSNDNYSQTFETTFDLSVHDIFVNFYTGGTLFCLSEADLFFPYNFIKKNNITVWFSVPSLIKFMQKTHQLKKNSFPSIRLSLFCGEPLNIDLVKLWQKAAQNSIVENLYGPTEATIAISHYRLTKSSNKIYNDIVSIGKIFSSQKYCIIDKENNIIKKSNIIGELCLSGSQVVDGYFNDNKNTEQKFICLKNKIYYKTGDLVKKDDDGDLYYIDRIDNQIKIFGHRIELNEIEFMIKKIIKYNEVVAIGYPNNNNQIEGIIIFITKKIKEHNIIKELKKKLPGYMIPKKIIYIKEFPLNTNGKIDRKKLLEIVINDKKIEF